MICFKILYLGVSTNITATGKKLRGTCQDSVLPNHEVKESRICEVNFTSLEEESVTGVLVSSKLLR